MPETNLNIPPDQQLELGLSQLFTKLQTDSLQIINKLLTCHLETREPPHPPKEIFVRSHASMALDIPYNSHNPVNVLPREIMLLVYEYLSPKDLLNAADVSLQWRDSVLSLSTTLREPEPRLKIEVTEEEPFEDPDCQCPTQLMAISGYKRREELHLLEQVRMVGVEPQTLTLNATELRTATPLLNLQSINNLKVVLTSYLCPLLQELLNSLPQLGNLSIEIHQGEEMYTDKPALALPDLQTLTVAAYRTQGFYHDPWLLVDVLPGQVEKLVLHGIPQESCEHLLRQTTPRKLRLEDSGLFSCEIPNMLVETGSALEELEINGADIEQGIWDNRRPKGCLPHLSTVRIQPGDGTCWEYILAILAETGGNLKELELSNNDIFGDDSFNFADLFKTCPSLGLLGIMDCPQFDNQKCKELGTVLTKLGTPNRIYIRSRTFSETGLRSLVTQPLPVELSIEDCFVAHDTLKHLQRQCSQVNLIKRV